SACAAAALRTTSVPWPSGSAAPFRRADIRPTCRCTRSSATTSRSARRSTPAGRTDRSAMRVVVVGAGVVGLACASELARAGADVVVLERGEVGAGASRGNTGWVCPSFTYPLPAPGMVREGLRQLVTGGEAFVLRPSLDPAFVRWLWSFRRSCSQPRFDAGVRALLALNRRTLELFDAYRTAGLDFEMHSVGLVVAARTHEGLDLYRAIFRRLRELGYEGGAIRSEERRAGQEGW